MWDEGQECRLPGTHGCHLRGAADTLIHREPSPVFLFLLFFLVFLLVSVCGLWLL